MSMKWLRGAMPGASGRKSWFQATTATWTAKATRPAAMANITTAAVLERQGPSVLAPGFLDLDASPLAILAPFPETEIMAQSGHWLNGRF